MICKLLGLIDISAATIIAFLDIPFIGPLKWIIVAILLIKGLPSLFG